MDVSSPVIITLGVLLLTSSVFGDTDGCLRAMMRTPEYPVGRTEEYDLASRKASPSGPQQTFCCSMKLSILADSLKPAAGL